jgi:RNA polymerase sigma factor (sigma-70 family)
VQGPGTSGAGNQAMIERQERSLSGEKLAELERRLHGRLRAHRLSSQLIARHLEDAVQKGVVECLRMQSEGTEVRDPEAFVAEAAFRRAIDEVRREARRADGVALDAMLETGRRSSASAEDVAIDNIESQRLQAAIESLPVEERQVLDLYYFDGLDQRGAAERLYVSERTYRRRLRRTLSDLAERLGAPAPEPRSQRGYEIGLAAWSALGGGRIASPAGVVAHIGSLVSSVYRGPAKIVARLRDPGTRLLASEAPEQAGAIMAGPAGKVIGGCAGALIVCALSGVVGPGVDLGGGGGGSLSPTARHHAARPSRPAATRPILVEPNESSSGPEVGGKTTAGTSSSESSPSPTPRHRHRHPRPKASKVGSDKSHHEPQPTESEAAEEQFSGIARAAAESESQSSDSGVEATSTEDAAPAPSPPAAAPAPEAKPAEQRQVEEQFRGPLAR